jgi:hypothetical protein
MFGMSASGWDPSWRRLLAGTIALFAIILAFLAGRVQGGADPALGNSASDSSPQATPEPSGGQGVDPYGQQGVDPYGQQGGQAPDGSGQSGGLDPLTTRSS